MLDRDPAAPPSGLGTAAGYAWGVLRLLVGFIFLWAFLDKLFGLGFATCRQDGSIDLACDAAFVQGGSPTFGFLSGATQASHAGGWFDGLASSGPESQNIIDWLFMAALLFIGVTLTLGILVRISGVIGALLVAAMYLAGFVWPENNPFVDDHVVEFVLLVSFSLVGAGRWLGLGRWWSRLPIIRRYPVLLS